MDAPPPVELAWVHTLGGEECIDQSELAAKVSAALGRPALATSPENQQGHAVVRGTVGRGTTGRGWVAVVEVDRAEMPPLRRELSLDASDCRELDEAIVLVIALLIDSAVSNPPPLTIERPAPALSVSIGPDLAIAAGMLPGLYFGFGLIGEAEIARVWPIALSAHEWPVTRETAGASGGQLGAWTVGVAVCPTLLARATWQIFVCAGGSGGEVRSNGIGLLSAHDNARAFVEVDGQVGLRFRLAGPVAARLGWGAGIPIVRDTYAFFESDGSRHDVFRTAVAVPMGELAIELQSPR
jgi:hypothetical protein